MKDIIVKGQGKEQKATGVRLGDGRVFGGKAVISNATRWDTFEKLMSQEEMPASEALFRHESPGLSHCPAPDHSLCSSCAFPQSYKCQQHGRVLYYSKAAAPPVQSVPLCAQKEATHPF